MADDLDAMLQGSDTTPASQAQNDGQGSDSIQGSPIEQQTPEEIEFNKLSGPAQDRIRKLVTRARTAEEKLQTQTYTPPQNNFAPLNFGGRTPDQEQALRVLEQAGISTDEKVDRKLADWTNQIEWNQQQRLLENKYDGSHGEPQYVREEVEDYITQHPQYRGYSAEDVFRDKMFRTEFRNLEINQGTRTGNSSTLRPTKAPAQDTGNYESILDRVNPEKYSDAVQYAEDHRAEVEAAVAAMTPGE